MHVVIINLNEDFSDLVFNVSYGSNIGDKVLLIFNGCCIVRPVIVS